VNLIHEYDEHVPIIVVSERKDVDFAIEVLRSGAFDYLPKPFNNIARVEKAVYGALSYRESARQAADLAEKELASHGLIGESKRLKDLLCVVKQIGPLAVNVLISGESGTGKELIARAIHAQSTKKSGPFLAVNCGALPEGLIESLFFGHEKGAFTGAVQAHSGFVESVREGTLFLDEVGELSPRAQVVLLRFLQEHEFLRVGGSRTFTSDARIIASTNRNLEEDVEQNRFRADLYFRLNVVHLKVPPLRDRPEDLVLLANHFLRRFCLLNGLPEPKLSPQAAGLLERYDWPGNVRELENLVNGLMAVLPARKQNITAKDILDYSEKIRRGKVESRGPGLESIADRSYKQAKSEFEKAYLKALLEKHQGNVAKAARTAGIHPVTFHRKLRELGLVRE
jgi:DNA-binding NtrC family response regulator